MPLWAAFLLYVIIPFPVINPAGLRSSTTLKLEFKNMFMTMIVRNPARAAYPTVYRNTPRRDQRAATSPRPPRRPPPTRGLSSRVRVSYRSRAPGSTARRHSPTRRTARAASPAIWPAASGSAGNELPRSRVNRRNCNRDFQSDAKKHFSEPNGVTVQDSDCIGISGLTLQLCRPRLTAPGESESAFPWISQSHHPSRILDYPPRKRTPP